MPPFFEKASYILHGRRKGRPLRTGKTALMQTLLPRIEINLEQQPNPADYFAGKDIWLEVGFGGGEHLAWQAKENPHIGMIGCEPYVNAVASLLKHIDEGKIENIRVWDDDARIIIDALPEHSISRVFVLFPDPWPKNRHANRRFIGPENLPKLARIMKSGAQLRVASDDPTLQEYMLEHMRATADFMPAPDTENGMRKTRLNDWPATRYEIKELAKKRPNWKGPEYYVFIRK
ncbi:MAG: tRNA (guanosine(46)-N7)-methyltransferase TrmB [Alphaproteobacteria bacterium]|nr:tRNA (guanosine(46)-N7)-methyltransferase TrmB [Alphaproteobacteria bacterium]